MLGHDLDSTICALATAPGSAGVAIIRLSGPRAIAIGAAMSGLESKRLRHCRLRFTRFLAAGGETLDSGYIVAMHRPRSFTGDDVVELHAHGSVAVVQALLSRACALGARPAERGEFSRRAFLAGKLDLSQAEALLDLVSAGTEAARTIALQHLDGRVGEVIAQLRAPIILAMAEVEARLDFSTAEDVGPVPADLTEKLEKTAQKLRSLASTVAAGRARMRGVRAAFYGAPNAGKSTLFNAVVGLDRALVHDQPGTTRDAIESHGELDGIAITWVDTAGIRVSDNPVEAAGIAVAERSVQTADIVVWLTDGTAADPQLPPPPGPPHRKLLRLLSKADRPAHASFAEHPEAGEWPRICATSAEDVTRLKRAITALAQELAAPPVASDVVLTRERHAVAMLRASEAMQRACQMLATEGHLELAAGDLHDAADALAEVTGTIAPDHVLDAVFGQFCIGK